MAACGHSPFSKMKAESVCPKDELNEGAVNRVGQSERNAEIRAPESKQDSAVYKLEVEWRRRFRICRIGFRAPVAQQCEYRFRMLSFRLK